MKRLLLIALITWGALPFAEEIKTRPMGEERIVHVATALDHLTVLEFSEPVTMAAAGSSAFQIERHDNKVFIKPLIPGTSTDLFVWTASRRFGYELEPAGEVKDMNFVVDAPAPLPAPATNSREQLDAIADTLLTSALLSAERIDHTNIKDFRGRVIVRIEHVFTSNTSCYIHYSVSNMAERPYRLTEPVINELAVTRHSLSVTALGHSQLNQQLVHRLGLVKHRTIPVSRAKNQKDELRPGEESHGILAIHEQITNPTILELSFGSDDDHIAKAVFVR